jgi:hypothetical protein
MKIVILLMKIMILLMKIVILLMKTVILLMKTQLIIVFLTFLRNLEQKRCVNESEEHTQQNSEIANVPPLNQPNIYRKEGILVVEAELPENFDVSLFSH